jgi:hypothetical protein
VIPFDDATLEDAWDASDTLLDQFDNVVLRIRELLADAHGDRRVKAMRLFDNLETIRERIRG